MRGINLIRGDSTFNLKKNYNYIFVKKAPDLLFAAPPLLLLFSSAGCCNAPIRSSEGSPAMADGHSPVVLPIRPSLLNPWRPCSVHTPPAKPANAPRRPQRRRRSPASGASLSVGVLDGARWGFGFWAKGRSSERWKRGGVGLAEKFPPAPSFSMLN